MRVLFCQMRILLLISFTDLVAKSRFKSNVYIKCFGTGEGSYGNRH